MPDESADEDEESRTWTREDYEFTEWLDWVEEHIAAIKPWYSMKKLEEILVAANRPAPTRCGCMLYRRLEGTTCVCWHDFDLHEEGRKCWEHQREAI